jgi:hypothetical protein
VYITMPSSLHSSSTQDAPQHGGGKELHLSCRHVCEVVGSKK